MKSYAYLDNVDGFASWDCSPSCEASVFETHVTTLKWSDMNITSGNKLRFKAEGQKGIGVGGEVFWYRCNIVVYRH